MTTIKERANALDGNVAKFQKLQYTLSALTEVESAIDDAVRLDELTNPLLELAGGLANHSVGKLNLAPIYSAPEVGGRNNVASAITATTEKAFAQLLPIRNRAFGHLITQYTALVNDQLDWLKNYSDKVFAPVRSAVTYGLSGLKQVRKLEDVEVRRLLAYGIEQTTHQKASELIIEMYSDLAASINAVATDKYVAEYLERNVERFAQGDGFSPVRFEGDSNSLSPNVKGFCSQFFNMGGKDGQAWSHDYVGGNSVDEFPIESMTLQDITIVIERLTKFTENMVAQVKQSPLLTSTDLNEQISEAVMANPLHIKLYRSYYGDSSINEEVSVMVNRIADVRIAQLRYVSYCLGNLISALPLIMNYCLRDKIN